MRQIDWDKLYRSQAPKIKGICRRYVGNAAVAEDLTQEAFITALEKIESYKGWGSLEGWIRKIAINKALRYLQSTVATDVSIDKMESKNFATEVMDTHKDTKRYAIEQAAFTTDELLQILDALPHHHRQVFNLYVLDGYRHKQIAEMLSISPGTSKSHLARARRKAQELLYQKASASNVQERKRNGVFLILLLFRHPVDRIFKKTFHRFSISTEHSSLNMGTGSYTLTGALTKGTIVGIGVFSICTAVWLMGKPIHNENSIMEIEAEEQSNQTFPVSNDTVAEYALDKQDELAQDTLGDMETDAEKPVVPVVIRKKIVVHDTIKVSRHKPQ